MLALRSPPMCVWRGRLLLLLGWRNIGARARESGENETPRNPTEPQTTGRQAKWTAVETDGPPRGAQKKRALHPHIIQFFAFSKSPSRVAAI